MPIIEFKWLDYSKFKGWDLLAGINNKSALLYDILGWCGSLPKFSNTFLFCLLIFKLIFLNQIRDNRVNYPGIKFLYNFMFRSYTLMFLKHLRYKELLIISLMVVLFIYSSLTHNITNILCFDFFIPYVSVSLNVNDY